MRDLKLKKHGQEHLVSGGVFLIVCLLPGCSTWSWKGGSQDGERLTRVIHAENARLKDLVVQLRASNEDMAQRALDDSARIANLETENQTLTTSVAAYQSERERMAKAFQNLQQQVQVALTDRGVVATNAQLPAVPTERAKSDDSSRVEPPPEGRYDSGKQLLVIDLDSWFAGDSAIVPQEKDERLGRLAAWISKRVASQPPARQVVAHSVGPKRDQLTRVSLPASPPTPSALEESAPSDRLDLDETRSKRLWEALSLKMRPDLAAQIRFDGKPKSGLASGEQAGHAAIVLQF